MMALDRVVLPLDHRMYSWFLANTSWGVNVTHFPTPPPQSSITSEIWHKATNMENALLNVAFQDVSLGVITLLALQKGVRCSIPQYHPVTKRAWRCNIQFFDIIITNILKTFVGMLLMAVAVPLAAPVVLVFGLASAVVNAIYRFKYSGCLSKAQGMDGVWGMESNESRPFITISLLLAGVPRLKDIQRHLRSKILDVIEEGPTGGYKYRKFRQVFSRVCGYYCWRDVDEFDVNDHVKLVDLKEFYAVGRGDEGRSEDMDNLVHRFISEEGTTALSPDRPPWEVLLLKRDDESYNVVVRLHHAIGDGVTLIRLCVEALVDTPLAAPTVGVSSGNIVMKALMAVWSALVLPLGLLKVVANFDKNSLHGQRLSGKKVMTSSKGLPLSMLREVKKAASATVNDVLMSCLAAALSKHFARRSETVSQVTAVMPVSFHDLRAPLSLTNKFSVATVKLPSSHALSPIARLRYTKTVLDGMKRDPTLAAVFWVVNAVSDILPAAVAELLLSGSGVSVAASNVPGPQTEISVWGDQVKDLLFWVPNRAPVGVGVSFASYVGMVKVGLNIDASLVRSRAEAELILKDMEVELFTLHQNLVLGRP